MEHRLDSITISTKPGFAVSVILASGGYPGSYAKGKEIQIGQIPKGILDANPKLHLPGLILTFSGVVVFHAGTTINAGKLLTSGGRVLAVSAYGATIQQALDSAYAAIQQIGFEGQVYRRDIARRYVATLYPAKFAP